MGKGTLKLRYIIITVLSIALAICIAICTVAAVKNFDIFNQDSLSSELLQSNTSDNEDLSNKLVAAATVVNTGDIMPHSPVINGAKTADGNYDFSAFFKASDTYFKNADLAVANFEMTLGGTESGPFAGYPVFNAPDSMLDTIIGGGINFLLTSNNHCYDTGAYGLKRTVGMLKQAGIEFNGTRESVDEPIYAVKDVNGIKIGIVNFTYENISSGDSKSINGIRVSPEAQDLINSFSYDNLDAFYATAQSTIDSMRLDGADAIVFYMHWGDEYYTTQNTWQKVIAQTLCNMGVDVIVGGHPHVVQPIELLHAEDSQNTTVCIYSLGNAISNQRQEVMSSCPTGHTEDGMLFYYTFSKYGDGTVVLSSIDIIPTWVNKYRGGSGYQYTMYPLENAQMASNYGFNSTEFAKAQASFERTKQIVMSGLNECQMALGCPIRFAQ